MRITRQDVEIRIAYANELLAEHGSDRRLHFSKYNDYYKIEERDITLSRTASDVRDYNGTKQMCYDWLIAFNRALLLTLK